MSAAISIRALIQAIRLRAIGGGYTALALAFLSISTLAYFGKAFEPALARWVGQVLEGAHSSGRAVFV